MIRLLLLISGTCLFVAGTAFARPIRYDLVQLVLKSPIIIEAKVVSRTEHAAEVTVIERLKGELAESTLHLADIPPRVPETPGIRLEEGEHLLLFLSGPDAFFAKHQSRLALDGSDHLKGLVSELWSLHDEGEENDAEAREFILARVRKFTKSSTTEKTMLLLLAGREEVKLPEEDVRKMLAAGIEEKSMPLRWRSFVTARERGLTYEWRASFVAALSDPNYRIRAACFLGLETLAGDSFGYDPRIAPGRQAQAIAAWRKWAARNKDS